MPRLRANASNASTVGHMPSRGCDTSSTGSSYSGRQARTDPGMRAGDSATSAGEATSITTSSRVFTLSSLLASHEQSTSNAAHPSCNPDEGATSHIPEEGATIAGSRDRGARGVERALAGTLVLDAWATLQPTPINATRVAMTGEPLGVAHINSDDTHFVYW